MGILAWQIGEHWPREFALKRFAISQISKNGALGTRLRQLLTSRLVQWILFTGSVGEAIEDRKLRPGEPEAWGTRPFPQVVPQYFFKPVQC
jgi:hypothetical protein